MDIRQKKGAITIGGVTLVVLAGAVTWNALARTEEADAGEVLRLETVEPRPSGTTAREQGLLDENEELKRRLAEAEARASRTRMEAEEADEPAAEDVVVAGEETDFEVRFSDDKYGEALAGVDWKVVGTAMKGQVSESSPLSTAMSHLLSRSVVLSTPPVASLIATMFG